MSDYKKTLNLPKTKFPMKANLVQQEPQRLKHWHDIDAFKAMVSTDAPLGEYVLHDGPPYANGHIHMGHALNKILKDIILKSRNMQGYHAYYVPGWDCHGLPIEHKVEEELKGKKKTLPAHVVRKICREYATKWVKIQKAEFQRLGVLGDWDHPYLSMVPEFEATTSRELANFVEKGNVIRAKKPIYWCGHCHTALAEAEVEYKDIDSYSIYVRFRLDDPAVTKVFPKADPSRCYVIIWTTTPWTIPDNCAVCLNPKFSYALVEADGEQFLLARDLLEPCAKIFGWEKYEILGEAAGEALEGIKARHPLAPLDPYYDRPSPIVLGGHVTLDSGTGCVHTAPGHGPDDYEVGLKYNLEILSPMDDAAVFLPTVPLFAGMNVFDANEPVLEKLKETGALMNCGHITHSYPCCWRCKKPLIFRATTQWFISMEKNDLRRKALDAIDNKVTWIPSWGRERIHNMIATRPDWCISRQRQWGVPIVALVCEDCGEAWNDPKWMREISDRFAKHPTGCDYWFEADLKDIVPEGLKCPHCGGQHWRKETDILDVWFDSGTTWSAVLKQRPELRYPADLYLEGSDQHRGWFQSSLLTSVATTGKAPYRAVLTHGYTLDGEGRKMSKSLGNTVAPQDIIKDYGADIVRLWVSSTDYKGDVRVSKEIIKHVSEVYRKIRNTIRYILGNTSDFDAETMKVPFAEMEELDQWALMRLQELKKDVEKAYENYDFHVVHHAIHDFCTVDMSSFYLDIIKDRLYASKKDDKKRRSAQTAMYEILSDLIVMLAPILSFTMEEVYQFMKKPAGAPESVLMLEWPKLHEEYLDKAKMEKWEHFIAIRGEITKVLENARREKTIGHSLDAKVDLYATGEAYELLKPLEKDLPTLLIVSQAAIHEGTDSGMKTERDDLTVAVAAAEGEKCERCWNYDPTVGKDPDHPTLCHRCIEVLSD